MAHPEIHSPELIVGQPVGSGFVGETDSSGRLDEELGVELGLEPVDHDFHLPALPRLEDGLPVGELA